MHCDVPQAFLKTELFSFSLFSTSLLFEAIFFSSRVLLNVNSDQLMKCRNLSSRSSFLSSSSSSSAFYFHTLSTAVPCAARTVGWLGKYSISERSRHWRSNETIPWNSSHHFGSLLSTYQSVCVCVCVSFLSILLLFSFWMPLMDMQSLIMPGG